METQVKRLLTTKGDRQAAEDTVDRLKGTFKDQEFEIKQNGTRHEIVLVTHNNFPTPEFESIRDVAREYQTAAALPTEKKAQPAKRPLPPAPAPKVPA